MMNLGLGVVFIYGLLKLELLYARIITVKHQPQVYARGLASVVMMTHLARALTSTLATLNPSNVRSMLITRI